MKDQRVPVEELFANERVAEKETLEQIRLANNIQGQIRGLWYCNRTFAIYAIKYKDFKEAKKSFDTCGKLDEFQIKLFEDRLLDAGIDHICYMLLSDNLELITRYSYLTHPWFAHTIKSGSLVHAMQCIIKEDWPALEQDIATYERITSTQKGKINIPDLMYFKGMLQKDKGMIEEALLLQLKDHKKRNKYMGIAQDYISVPALGYAKLAWLKGIEVQVDHPLIPKELLPYRPLEKYEDKYDFLK
ncbi:Imm49 family immunity protein [Pedobacter montanisoli]|uniref:Immunity 49 family protein n=1 Tax=Pedobacter montanisoli TaxID=2923277 RepID=A0ABS9ZYB6_9SPHI|nr:Imm49 family immunity protein [Pedobacter montanisoli]MCJ0743321.1 immunity 49 family protein [Pedobacter montanisoli]